MKETFRTVRDRLREAASRREIQYNRNSAPIRFRVGDKVYLKNEKGSLDPKRKFRSRYIGPYRITDRFDETTFKVVPIYGGKPQVTHANRLKPAKGLEEILEPLKQFVNPDYPEGERAILDGPRIEPDEQPQEVERANLTESDLDDVPSNLSDIMSNPNYLSSLPSLQENSLAEPPLTPTTPSPLHLPPSSPKPSAL